MTDHLKEETIHTEGIYKGRIIDLEKHTVRLPNGSESKREIVRHPGAVGVICVRNGKLILVYQFRKALGKVIAEIPAGKLDEGESPEICAARELEEETGIKAGSCKFLCSFYTSPGFADELVHIYIADELESGHKSADEDEFVEVVEVSLDEAAAFIQDGTIHDAKTMYAVQYLQLQQK
ncbi:NUDIX domain-containing protein [Alkalicoccus luteus]|uniref:NUDIX hydrolase n=1 Tax=Alkalicoccus luteus TaxID=1237094 RepID=A0A969TW55_9BACI|nr:NUDIX hydrolase [Alkalicoccus luteus]NJP38827.1 NUDIX hydrolase [Alkalicoccus luteus]